MNLKELKNIEHAFFETDEENKIAKVVLHYERPEDLFEENCSFETPLLSEDTLATIQRAFLLVPKKYKVELTLRFDDLESFTEEELTDIVIKNFGIELKSIEAASRRREKHAYGFLSAGILCFLFMFMLQRFWTADVIWNELFFFLLDIMTTVFFYEAVTILSLERREKMYLVKKMHDSFYAIHFEQA